MARRIDRNGTAGQAAGARGLANEIDENLRRVYQVALTEEVPDRFRDLLAMLRAREDQGAVTAAGAAGSPGTPPPAGTAPAAEDAP